MSSSSRRTPTFQHASLPSWHEVIEGAGARPCRRPWCVTTSSSMPRTRRTRRGHYFHLTYPARRAWVRVGGAEGQQRGGSGHAQLEESTLQDLKSRYHWEGVDNDLKVYLRHCLWCRRAKSVLPRRAGKLQQTLHQHMGPSARSLCVDPTHSSSLVSRLRFPRARLQGENGSSGSG